MSQNEPSFDVGIIAKSLTEEEIQLLNLIRRAGAIAPAELAVKTFKLPEDADVILNNLGQKGLITTQGVESTSSPQLITLTDLGLRVARSDLLKTMR